MRVTGLGRGLSDGLARWRAPRAVHDPGKIVADLAAAVALGGDCLADIAVLREQPELAGPVASDPVVSRLVSVLAADLSRSLKAIRAARSAARERAWALAGDNAPGADGLVTVDLDATIVIAHSPALATRSLAGILPFAEVSGRLGRVADVKARLLTVRWHLDCSGGSKVGGTNRAPGRAGGAGSTAAEAIRPAPDPVAFQEECLRAFEASQIARGFSEQTIGNGAGTLQRFLAACGRPAWEVNAGGCGPGGRRAGRPGAGGLDPPVVCALMPTSALQRSCRPPGYAACCVIVVVSGHVASGACGITGGQVRGCRGRRAGCRVRCSGRVRCRAVWCGPGLVP
jgi:Transposase DDE domain group 1